MLPLASSLPYRLPEFYSPSQAALFFTDRMEYYRRYLAHNRPPRLRQTPAMAIGGAVDCYIKREIAEIYLDPSDPRLAVGGEYDLAVTHAHAVDADGEVVARGEREALLTMARAVVAEYKRGGSWARLLAELDLMDKGSLVMEARVTVELPVPSRWEDGSSHGTDVPCRVLGLPDLSFTIGGVWHVYDFKCNGAFSKAGASPIRGYIWKSPNKGSDCCHREVIIGRASSGVLVDLGGYFDETYLRQMSTYKVALAGVGCSGDYIAGIEQFAFKPVTSRTVVGVRRYSDGVDLSITCASSRAIIPHSRVEEVMADYLTMHRVLHSGHVFEDVSLGESIRRCEQLELECSGFVGDLDFNALCGR